MGSGLHSTFYSNFLRYMVRESRQQLWGMAMSRSLRIEYPGAYYHITSRGNEKKDIFNNPRDREKFLEYLDSATLRYSAVIHAYCLMGNHYHLLLETPNGNLSSIMRHINGAYTTYFNIKKNRTGHLFQGRFKAFLVEADSYLLELSRYIHLNPVRAKIVDRPEQYAWSSYRCYAGLSTPPEWLNTGFILDNIADENADRQKEYRLFVESRIGREDESPLVGAVGASILGAEAFTEKIISTYLIDRKDKDIPALRQLTGHPTPEDIIRKVGLEITDNEKMAKRTSIYLCWQLSGMRLADIGARFNMRETAISETIRRFTREMNRDDKVNEVVNKLIQGFKTCRM